MCDTRRGLFGIDYQEEALRLPICPKCHDTKTVIQLDEKLHSTFIMGAGNTDITYGCCSCAVQWNSNTRSNSPDRTWPLVVKVIIAGSRTITDQETVFKAVDKIVEEYHLSVGEVVSGKARGVDTLGEEWAETKGIPVRDFPADWENLGRRAGFVRNGKMAMYSNVLIALLPKDEDTPGTKNMIDQAKANALLTYIVRVEVPNMIESVRKAQEEINKAIFG